MPLPRPKYLRECRAFTVGRATLNFWPSTLAYSVSRSNE